MYRTTMAALDAPADLFTWFRLDRHDGDAPTGQPGDTGTQDAPDNDQGQGDQGAGQDGQQDKDKNSGQDIESLPEWARKALRTARADAAKARTAAKAQAAEDARKEIMADLAKALKLDGDQAAEDPAALVQAAQASAWRSGVELAVHRAAGERAGDLLDSMQFIDTLDDLTELDPGSKEFRDALKVKVDEALEWPRFKAAGQGTGPKRDPGQGGRQDAPTNFATADAATFTGELAKYGLRPRST